ncbi:MAG: hypothetical protein ACRDPO_15205, partial [Streptosporangiaceae bacterium]
ASIAGARRAAAHLPGSRGAQLAHAASAAYAQGMTHAAVVGAGVLLAGAILALLLLPGRPAARLPEPSA